MTVGHIKSAKRTLELFEMFAAVQKPMSVTQIADYLDTPQSSTSELLQSLVALGYLENDKTSRTYYPTVRIAMLSTWIHRRHEEAGRLPGLLAKMSRETGETAIFTMRIGIDVQNVLVHYGPNPDCIRVDSGNVRPLTCCASGWALLAAESDGDVGKIMRRVSAETTNPHWRKTCLDAAEGVRHYRAHGYAMTRNHLREGSSGIAVRLPRAEHESQFAVAVVGPPNRIAAKLDMILAELHELLSHYDPSRRSGQQLGRSLDDLTRKSEPNGAAIARAPRRAPDAASPAAEPH
ncbi:MAG: helix-turn-helix domain-containing protein [Caulobacterales bacterium]|nr:helix-turn-helix domain-containing protein [Caulobacterales bacterium]